MSSSPTWQDAPVAIGGAARRAREWLPWALAFVFVCGLALWIGWVGFIASDDALYYDAADHWLTAPPFAGDTHWATRFPVVLGFAAALALFGRSLLAFDIVSLFWYAMLIALIAGLARRSAGWRAGWIAAILAASLPVITTNASIVNCDLPEACFLLAGAWLLLEARQWRDAALAGLCFGLAVLCRETAILMLAGLVPVFLAGRPVPRHILLAAAAGAALVLGAELLFQYGLTGDPLHRYHLAAHHDAHIDRAANLEGNLLVHPLVDPLLVLLINNEFGLLFWVGAAAVAGGGWRLAGVAEKRTLMLVGAMGLSVFLLLGVLQHTLVLNPRYFTFVAIWTLLLIAGWLAKVRTPVAAAVLGLIVAVDLLMLGLANAHPHWESEALAIAAREYPGEIVAADREVVDRGGLRLIFDGLTNVRSLPLAEPTLILVQGGSAPAGTVAVYPSPPTRIGGILAWVGLSGAIPASIYKRVIAPNVTVYLVRRGAVGTAP